MPVGKKIWGRSHLRGGVLDLEQLQDRRAVVGDGHVTDVVDEHLVQTDGAEGGLDDVRHRLDRHDCFVGARRELAGDQSMCPSGKT